MPAFKPVLALALLCLTTTAISSSLLTGSNTQSPAPAPVPQATLSGPLASALKWLVANQAADGSYGGFLETHAAAAAYALWLNNSNSPYARSSYSYLAGQLDDPLAWFWYPFGEADYPGALLYSLAISQHLGLLNKPSTVASRILQFQQSNGGFLGYYDPTVKSSVTSSVDTALAIWGLTNAGAINDQNRTSAADYLLSLQNSDGSFSLTSTVQSDAIYSTGPDPVSITALVVLALQSASFNINKAPISKALVFLSQSADTGFNGPGHVYSASLSTLAFASFYRPRDVSKTTGYILSYQRSDGGFRDDTRLSTVSNALDTGWAAIALQIGMAGGPAPGPTDRPPVAKFNTNPETPTVGTTVQFDASESYDPDGDSLSYRWYFGDGATANGTTATHSYSRDGTFTVTLTVVETANIPSLQNAAWRNLTVQPKAQAPPKPAAFPYLTEIILGTAGLAFATLVVTYLVFRRRRKTGA